MCTRAESPSVHVGGVNHTYRLTQRSQNSPALRIRSKVYKGHLLGCCFFIPKSCWYIWHNMPVPRLQSFHSYRWVWCIDLITQCHADTSCHSWLPSFIYQALQYYGPQLPSWLKHYLQVFAIVHDLETIIFPVWARADTARVSTIDAPPHCWQAPQIPGGSSCLWLGIVK